MSELFGFPVPELFVCEPDCDTQSSLDMLDSALDSASVSKFSSSEGFQFVVEDDNLSRN